MKLPSYSDSFLLDLCDTVYSLPVIFLRTCMLSFVARACLVFLKYGLPVIAAWDDHHRKSLPRDRRHRQADLSAVLRDLLPLHLQW